MTTRRLVPVVAALLAIAVTGCSAIRVTTDWDHAVDFSRYRTFRWAPTEKGSDYRTGDRSLLDARIRRNVNTELQARGMEYREDGNADLLLVYRVSSRRRADVYRTSGYWRPYGRVVDVEHYREGTLLLMMVDPKHDQVVWEGAAVAAIRAGEGEEQVTKAVQKVLEDFPPK
jgi:Domain of unknown function (DUF4136)